MKKASTREVLGFNDLWFILLGILTSTLVLPLILGGIEVLQFPHIYFSSGAMTMLFTTFYWLCGRQTVIFFRRRFPGLAHPIRRVALQSAFMLVLVLSVNQLCEPLMSNYFQHWFGPGLPNSITIPVLLLSLILSVAILGIYEAVYMLQQWRAEAIETERLRKENVLAQLSSLKAQVNPHFLFNSLNTLTSIVHEDPDLSVEFIRKLATTYRYLLEIRNGDVITLGEEMECVQAYIFLLKTRFGEALHVHFDIPKASTERYIIPLSVQMLIENSIKHNVVSRRRPLHIHLRVATDGSSLTISNNKQKKLHPEPSTGTGLDNIRTRYALVSDRLVEILDSEEKFEVILPLITVNVYESTHH